MKINKTALWAVFAVFIGVIAGLILASNFDLTKHTWAANETQSSSDTESTVLEPEVVSLQNMSKGFAAVARKVKPSVVTIKSSKTVRTEIPEFWRQFFNVPDEQIRQGLGSGVIVSHDGYILTNNHVVADSDELQVTIGSTVYDAKIVGRDPQSDLAVIKIDAKNLAAIRLGDSDELEVGEWVLAVGNPFSELLDQTVTAGIVSAKGRSGLTQGEISFEDFIQTDAAINPGNSGGALVNLRGELVGINTMIYSNSGGSVGIGFAIPVNLAKNVMKQLIESGKVSRGWLGVYIGNVSEEAAEAFGMPKAYGALVNQVTEKSPAEEAGIKSGDVIIKVNDKEIKDTSMLMNTIAAMAPGTRVNVTIWRDGKEKVVSVKLGERPDTLAAESGPATVSNNLGLEVGNITSENRRRFNLQDDEGVVVLSVKEGSPAARQGIRPGDMIKEVNRKKVTTAGEFNAVIRDVKPGEVVLFRMKRGNNSFFAAVRMPKAK